MFVIRSMTGFGRGEFKTDRAQCVAEIKTVNHRYSDFTIKMPRELYPLEDRVRTYLKDSVQRGKADVYITYTVLSGPQKRVTVDEITVGEYFRAMESAAGDLGYRFSPDASMLFRIPDAFVLSNAETDTDEAWEVLSQALSAACGSLTAMRTKEGAKLAGELRNILSNTELLFTRVRDRSPLVPLEYREKLTARIRELLGDVPTDEQRIAAETAMFADKCSIDEEIARFDSHIKQFSDILSDTDSDRAEPCGRKLDFIVQEMNREVNTMGSKANDIEITNNVIALKSEIEKLREQIQNLE